MQWIDWSLGNATLRDEGEVDILQTAEDLTRAGRIQRCSRDGVLRQAVDGDRRAPLRGGAASADYKLGGYPTGRIELHLHKCCAGVFADKVRAVWVRVIEDVAIAIGCASGDLLGIGLRVAQGHTKPEGWIELEVEGLSTFRRSVRFWCWIARELETPLIAVARTSYVGVEEV